MGMIVDAHGKAAWRVAIFQTIPLLLVSEAIAFAVKYLVMS
jgi:hypothetical protein